MADKGLENELYCHKGLQNAPKSLKIGPGGAFIYEMRNTQVSQKKAHFIGIGGIGVSALARYFRSQGWEISGSDMGNSPLLQELKKEGAKIKIDHRKSNLPLNTELVIYTQATPKDNPELKEAKRRKIQTLTYPQALGELTREFTTIALAGTHGKSTATALTALALIEGGFDPTVIVGTKIPALKGKNFRRGRTSTSSAQESKYLVIEADEYKDAFLHYSPTAALITNIDREHLDYFKDLNHIKRSFLKFTTNLATYDVTNKVLVLNRDSSPLFLLRSKLRSKKPIWYSLKEKKLAQKIKRHLKIPGEHNLSNALGVYKLARALGVKEKDIFRAFLKYHGSWRRMELRGNLKIEKWKLKIPVYDDYAHHPTEIKATLSAFREKFPRSKIICVFQPHQADRLKKLFKDFTSAFDEADTLILLDIFKVRGREISSNSHGRESLRRLGTSSKSLAEAIQKRKGGPKVTYLPKPSLLRNSITRNLFKIRASKLEISQPPAVVIMMGAGDIVNLTPRLLK